MSFETRSDIMLRAKTDSQVAPRLSLRPVSQISDHLDTEFEDDSDFEDNDSWKSSFDWERRRSATTISSFDEVPTPDSSLSGPDRAHFDVHIKSVEGPKGPHLFRTSQVSTDTFDYALQLSPLLPKEPHRRPATSFSEETVTPTTRQRQEDFSIAAALAAPELDSFDPEGQIRQWNAFQVVDWMHTCGMDSAIIDCFEANDIDGNVLLNLQFDHLRDQLGIQSFGKRVQLWSAISSLRGEEAVISPQGTPFQDTSRPCTRVGGYSSKDLHHNESDGEVTPIEISGAKKRRGRKAPNHNDIITPAESVSIVAIEQLIPKPHKCHKGERCAKWRKQQRELQQLGEDGIGRFPVSPTKGGRIYISGDPGNAATAYNVVPNCRKQAENTFRHTTDTVPSITASSDLLGPGQLPEFALQEDVLGQLGNRDPQDNVRHFLNLQHVHQSTDSPVELAGPGSISRSTSVPPMFPEHHHQAYPSLASPKNSRTPDPRGNLQMLPKLEIPRSQSTAPGIGPYSAHNIATSPCRSATVSPSMVYRLGSPHSEMDVPVTAIPTGPISRDMSQSVPAGMQFRQQNRNSRSSPVKNATMEMRRPSIQLPALKENEVLPSGSDRSPSNAAEPRSSHESGSPGRANQEKTRSTHDPQPDKPAVKYFSYGEDCSHAGYMKKRKTKLLRHEWQEGHFRLVGSQLSMHENARISAAALEKINVEDYGIGCSTAVSSGKLSAAMKAFHIKSQSADPAKADQTAFNFQLIPHKEGDKKAAVSAKTHHFAVKTKDERIDWMRELMLAKALQQKGKGYDVEVNGERF